jgi:hypothetical protein
MKERGPGYLGCDIPLGAPGYNPYVQSAYLLTVVGDLEDGYIIDANGLLCDLIGWERGEYGDPYDPNCTTQTLIGKPLDVLVPPRYRASHRLFHMAFQAHPVPRTMGAGRNTPIWVKDHDVTISGLDSITGREATVLIGLSAIDEHHALAIIQPMAVTTRRLALDDH